MFQSASNAAVAEASEESAVAALLRGFSTELTPRAAQNIGRLDGLLPPGTAVYVPHLPSLDYAEAVPPLCARLRREGLRPVPHLAVRAAASREQLDAWLDALVSEGGARDILLLAGAAESPAGPFTSTLAVLEQEILLRHGIYSVGVAGHPEGHPHVAPAALNAALRTKQDYADATGSRMWITTQFTFSAEPVIQWLRALREAKIRLPVRVGLPGPATPRTLLRYALECGIGPSIAAVRQRPAAVTNLFSRWTPEPMIAELASHANAQPDAAPEGLHVFPFGGLRLTSEWIESLRVPAASYSR